MCSSAEALGVRRGAQHGAGEVRAADRFAGGDALFDLGFVEVEADLAQGVAHAQRALLAVGQEVHRGSPSSAGPCGRCRSRGCAVRAAPARRRRRRRSRPRGRSSRRRARPAAIASATPAIVSWSESASSSTPASAARATTSVADRTPSELVECDCRSKRGATRASVCDRLRGRSASCAGRLRGGSGQRAHTPVDGLAQPPHRRRGSARPSRRAGPAGRRRGGRRACRPRRRSRRHAGRLRATAPRGRRAPAPVSSGSIAPGCSSWRSDGITFETSQRCSPCTRSSRQMSGGCSVWSVWVIVPAVGIRARGVRCVCRWIRPAPRGCFRRLAGALHASPGRGGRGVAPRFKATCRRGR